MVRLLGNICWHSEQHLHCGKMGRLSEELCDYRRSNKILSMDWKKWEHQKVHLGKNGDSGVSSQRGCVCDEACGRGEKSRELLGGVLSGAGALGAGYRGRCCLCFRRLAKRPRPKPNPGQSSSAATLGFPGAVSSASPLSEASDHQRPGEAKRPEAEEVCLNREATSTIAGFEAKTVSGGQVM